MSFNNSLKYINIQKLKPTINYNLKVLVPLLNFTHSHTTILFTYISAISRTAFSIIHGIQTWHQLCEESKQNNMNPYITNYFKAGKGGKDK